MNYTYRVYTTRTIGVFSNKDDALNLLYNINNSKIEVFQNLTPIGIYTLNNNELFFNNTKVELEGFMKTWFANNNTELNVFIPFVSTEEEKNNNIQLNPDELLEKIKKLEEDAKLNDDHITKIKENIHNNEETFNQKKLQFEKEKKELEKDKEKWHQFKSKLEADKRVYYIIKEQLESGELTEDSMPILFQDKYPIFKHMDDNKLLYNDDTLYTEEINNYLMVLPIFNTTSNIIGGEKTTFSDLFSSSDPVYLIKKNDKFKNTETTVDE